jgi:hypothetical protein
MGRKPRVERSPEEKWQSCRKASRAGTSRRRVGVTESLRICSIAGRMKRSREQRQRLGEKRCRGRNREDRRIRQLERTLGRKSLEIEILKNVVGSELWCGSLPGARDGDAGQHSHAGGGDVGHRPIESVYYQKRPRGSRADRTYDEQTVVACGGRLAYAYWRVAWWLQRKKGLLVNRKRVLRVMRERGMLVRAQVVCAHDGKKRGRVEAASDEITIRVRWNQSDNLLKSLA